MSGCHRVMCTVYTAASANPTADRLLAVLLRTRSYNPQTIPVSHLGQTVHVRLGLAVQKIIQVVCPAKC